MRVFLFIFLLSQCQSVKKDKREVPLRILDQKNPEAQIPKAMWSPTERRASASYYYLIGEHMALSGQYGSAAEVFELAYSLDANAHLAAKMISLNAELGKDNLKDARKMVLLYPKSSRLRNLYGQLLMRQKKVDEARKEFGEGVKLDPGYSYNYLSLIQLELAADRVTRANKIAKQFTNALPATPASWAFLARTALKLKKKKEALYASKTLVSLDGRNPEHILLYALALEVNGQRKKSISFYEQLYRINPDNPQLVEKMVSIYRSMGHLEDSLELLEGLTANMSRKNPGIEVQKAIILWNLKRFDQASELLVSLAKEYPEQDRVNFLCAIGLERVEKQKEAVAFYKKVRESFELWPRAQLRIAILTKIEGDLKSAIEILEFLRDKKRLDLDGWVVLGGFYRQGEDYASAAKVYQEGYQIFPENHQFLFLQAIVYEKKNDFPKCETTLKELIEKDPSHVGGMNFLGYLYAERGIRLDKAENLISDALAVRPEDPYYLDSLGWVFYQKGQYEKALVALKKSASLLSKDSMGGVVYEHIAETYLKLKEKEKAKENIKKAYEGRSEGRDRKRIEKRYQELMKD